MSVWACGEGGGGEDGGGEGGGGEGGGGENNLTPLLLHRVPEEIGN